ncbi:hypothetical protein RFN29_25730 [Mesorhizobium sp. VK22B]|uniref:Uncharacterized protein n=1 Tax=Mesorhizobium captivum TaxID=3072319 RepID=A0ABU4Z8Q6_9HYPH|nr:hypothetical protein [Mesorhizobium sp. VK22B]MDX8494963.1 hypothetical protein [Mesorhizobium sp. VK22B]
MDAVQWYEDVITDLGGESQVSLAKRTMLERAAFVRAMLMHMEYLSQDGEKIDMKSYSNQTQVLLNVLKTVGMEKVLRDITPDLSRYIAEHEQANGQTVDVAPGRWKQEPPGWGHRAPIDTHDPVTENSDDPDET